jgi:beta-phosphoglucomutase-like phosphatase (HAD superfamily)
VDSEGLSARVLLELLPDSGLPFTRDEFGARLAGVSYPVLYAGLHRDYGWTRPADFDARVDAGLAAALDRVPAIEGAAQTLRALRAAGVPLAVASNSRRDRLELKLRVSGLDGLVGPHAHDPAQVGGRGKPAPDLYLYAAQELGADVTRCLVVEDSVTGAQAGLAAGATVWGLLAGGHVHPALASELTAAGAQRVIGSHAGLRAALGLA